MVLTILLLIFILIMRYLDSYLINENAKNGIVSFELAKSMANSRLILNSWNVTARSAAGLSLGLDFLFLLIYSSFIAVLIGQLNNRLWKNRVFFIFGKLLIIAIFVAAFFDLVENIALINILLESNSEAWPLIAYYFASIKFIIILIGIIYIIVNAVIFLFQRLLP